MRELSGRPADPPRTTDGPPVAAGAAPTDRPARRVGLARDLLVGLLAFAVVAGVVASALVARSRPGDGGAGVPAAQGPTTAPAPYVPLGKPMPSGCEVDPSSPPVLAFEDVPLNRLALGAMAQGQQLDKTVTVRNTGRGVLCVRDVEYGCGCVKARWDGEARVPPAGSGTVAIHVDTTDLAGPVEKWVTLYTNDPARQPGAVLLVSFDVRLGILMTAAPGVRASHLDFGTHARGKPATGVLRLTAPKDGPEWTVLGVESAAQPEVRRVKLVWALVPVESDDPEVRRYELRITHPGRAEVGVDEQLIRIRTSHPARPELQADAVLTVVPKYYAVPAQAGFGSVRPGDVPPTRTIEVRAAEIGTDFRVTGATVDGTGFVAGEPRRLEKGWGVEVRYDGKARGAGRVEATLVVRVDDPDLPALRVPLVATATGG